MDIYLDQFAEDQIDGGFGSILGQIESDERFGDDEPICRACEDFGCGCCIHLEDDEPNDHILAQQEMEDFEKADEYFGFDGDDTGGLVTISLLQLQTGVSVDRPKTQRNPALGFLRNAAEPEVPTGV